MNKLELQKIIKNDPNLTMHGFSDNLNPMNKHYGNINSQQSPMTINLLDKVNLCEDWLLKQNYTKTLVTNGRPTTYQLKHYVEREKDTYIPAGCMIAAVLHLGIDYKRKPFTPDIWIPVSKKIV